MNGLKVTVSNPPIPQKPSCCTEPGCKFEANRVWLGFKWLCNWHYYRRERAAYGETA